MPPSATEGKRVLLQAKQKLTNVLVSLAYPVSPVAVVVVVVVTMAALAQDHYEQQLQDMFATA